MRASSPLQGGEIQCAPPRIAVHKENVYIAVNLLDNKMKLFRSADCVNWHKVSVPLGAISCHGVASGGESLFLYFMTAHCQNLFVAREVDDTWITSSDSCPIVQQWPGMCVREGQVRLVSGYYAGTVIPYSTSYNSECDSWSTPSDNPSESFPNLLWAHARARPDLFYIGKEWYIVGGSNQECFDPLPTLRLTKLNGTWSWTGIDLPSPLRDAATAERDGWLFSIGGALSFDVSVSWVACVNIRNGELVQLPSMPNSRVNAALAVFRDKLVLFGGHPQGKHLHFDDVLVLDIS